MNELGRFIYVFSIKDRDSLLSRGYEVIKSDELNNVYVFENNNQLNFSFDDEKSFVFSNTLTL